MEDTTSTAIPEVKTITCVDFMAFLNHCVFWQIIDQQEIKHILANLLQRVDFREGSYIPALWIQDAEYYSWKHHEITMFNVGREFRKLYPNRIDLLHCTW